MKLTVSAVRKIHQHHVNYWSEGWRLQELQRLHRVYMTRFWRDQDKDDQLTVETSDAYAYIESYVASLYARNPATVFRSGLRSKGDLDKAEASGNHWLSEFARIDSERTNRLALIFPFAAVKLYPVPDEPDVFRRIRMCVMMPWEVIVDERAGKWDDQRWMGHCYWMPLGKAIEVFGPKRFDVSKDEDYFEPDEHWEEESSIDEDDPVDKKLWGSIQVVELYHEGQVYFWSPQYAEGKRFIATNPVSFIKWDDRPVVPIIPMYMNYDPREPLRGYSALRRIYDQLREKNTLRTYKASGVRKSARVYLAIKGILEADDWANIQTGKDGMYIEIEPQKLKEAGVNSIHEVVAALKYDQMPAELDRYGDDVQRDLDKGSVLAPFTRGEATKATATEVKALGFYSSTEVGRMARERDAFLERLVETYLPMLALYLEEDGEVVAINGRTMTIRPEDLLGDFRIFAKDSARTPVTDESKKAEYLQLLEFMIAMGTPPDVLKRYAVDLFDLPEDFASLSAPAPKGEPGSAPAVAGGQVVQMPTR